MKKIIFVAALVISILTVTSACKNPPILAAIEQEVKLKPASITGFVRGIIRIENTFYTSNGKMFKKPEGNTGKWSEMSGCPAGFCTSIATDGTNLYAAFGNKNTFSTYKYDPAGSSWTKLPAPADSALYIIGTETVFAVNQTQSGNYTLYTIKSDKVIHTWSNAKFPSGAARTYCLLEDGLYSETGSKIAGSPNSSLKGICEGPETSVFVFNDSTLYCYDGNTWTNIKHNVSDPQSIAYLPGKQLVLISGKKGYGEIKLADSNLTDAQSVQTGSESSSVPPVNIHQYNNSVGKYALNPINAFDYNGGYIVYVGANDPNTRYTGLWGIYVPGQIEWNRE